MKKKSIISLFALLLGFGVSTTSCEDMLTPDMDRYAEGFNGRDTVNFYLGIVANVQGMIENNVILGEIRSDLTTPTEFVSDTVSKLANFEKVPDADNGLVNRAAYYKVINQCNFYLAAVDTLAQKNNNQYMCKEFAQVQFIRAWVYMQLVQLYGEVPFITLPVDNAGTGWEVNPHGGWANADNLLEKLQQNGLDLAYNYEQRMGWPNYGTFLTGANGVDIAAQLLLFPGDVVLGDLYLLRGNGEADYLKAAEHYYNYLEDYGSGIQQSPVTANKMTLGDKDVYTHSAGSWILYGSADYTYAPTREWTTLIPSAANNSLGKTLMRTAQIYGFDPSSSTSTSMETNEDNSEEAKTTGEISVVANYKNRQIAPSQAYINLNKAQDFRYNEMEAGVLTKVEYPEDFGDGRLAGSVQYLNTLGGRLPFVQKFAYSTGNNETNLSGFKFRYAQPVYRKRQIWLRYAEAINRAGFPRHAFAILRDGLGETTIPSVKRVKTADDVNKKYVLTYELDNVADGCYYLDIDEVTRAKALPYLDFSDSKWRNSGVHELGCGESSDKDTVYTYGRMVGLRMKSEAARTGSLTPELKAYADSLIATGANPFAYVEDDATDEEEEEEEEGEGEGEEVDRTNYPTDTIDIVTLDNPRVTLAREINAVETLIADEMALETAFEGWRYFDLVRIARHKNADANFSAGTGTSWFAWLVARRNMLLKPYEAPETKDDALYNLLLDPQNWYLQNPQY